MRYIYQKGCDKVENNPIPILLTEKQLMADIDVVKIVQKWIEISNQLSTYKIEIIFEFKILLALHDNKCLFIR